MRILVKTHVKVGEVAIDICMLNAIARLEPDCHLEVLATSPTHSLLTEAPYIDHLHVRSQHFLTDIVQQVNLMRKKWDVVLVTRRASTLQPFYFFANAGHKRCMRYMDTPDGVPEMVIRLSMLAGILEGWKDPIDPTIHFDPKRTDDVATRLSLDRNKRFLTIAPGASHEAKKWDKDKFVALTKRIGDRFDQVLVLGSKDESTLCEYVASETDAVNVAGKLELLDVCALLSFVTLQIGNDSGLGHLAAGVGTRCAVIGDESGPRYEPWGQHLFLGDPKQIEVEEITKFLDERKLI